MKQEKTKKNSMRTSKSCLYIQLRAFTYGCTTFVGVCVAPHHSSQLSQRTFVGLDFFRHVVVCSTHRHHSSYGMTSSSSGQWPPQRSDIQKGLSSPRRLKYKINTDHFLQGQTKHGQISLSLSLSLSQISQHKLVKESMARFGASPMKR